MPSQSISAETKPMTFSEIRIRPFQPGEGFSAGEWRTVADRVVVTVHDFISYQIGAYSGTAESWSSSPDGLTLTFKLRSDLKFPDGTPATAEDAAWSLQRC